MYCPSCGRSIPDGSAFCLHCGKPTAGQTPSVGFSDQPAKYITEVDWRGDAPYAKDWRGHVYTGFMFWFALLDASRNPTRADGTISLKMSKVKKEVALIILTAYEKRNLVFETTIPIRKDQFRPSRKDPSFLGCFLNIEEAVLKESEIHNIEIWFTTADGRKLYGTDRR